MTTFKPSADRILVKPAEAVTEIAGLQVNWAEPAFEGLVIAVGDGVPLDEVTLKINGNLSQEGLELFAIAMDLIKFGRKVKFSPGDRIAYGKHAGTQIMHNGELHLILREKDCFGTIED